MHIPDGFLDTKTWISLGVVSIGAAGVAVKQINKKFGDKQIPVMGVVAAFIFAAQMLNFPIGGGTSGHFMGAALASIILGPFTGILIMTTVLIVQCLVFQDGGLTALGANIFNMGIVGSFTSYYVYTVINKLGKKGIFVGTFAGAWLSIVVAAAFCAVELAVSGTTPIRIVLPAMVAVHAVIGVVEGLITVSVITFILKVRPDILELEKI